jgi:hypothetical protein
VDNASFLGVLGGERDKDKKHHGYFSSNFDFFFILCFLLFVYILGTFYDSGN